jgi:hypothetical protein
MGQRVCRSLPWWTARNETDVFHRTVQKWRTEKHIYIYIHCFRNTWDETRCPKPRMNSLSASWLLLSKSRCYVESAVSVNSEQKCALVVYCVWLGVGLVLVLHNGACTVTIRCRMLCRCVTGSSPIPLMEFEERTDCLSDRLTQRFRVFLQYSFGGFRNFLLLLNPKVQHNDLRKAPLDHVLIQFISVHTAIICFSNIRCNIILLSVPRSLKWALQFRFSCYCIPHKC